MYVCVYIWECEYFLQICFGYLIACKTPFTRFEVISPSSSVISVTWPFSSTLWTEKQYIYEEKLLKYYLVVVTRRPLTNFVDLVVFFEIGRAPLPLLEINMHKSKFSFPWNVISTNPKEKLNDEIVPMLSPPRSPANEWWSNKDILIGEKKLSNKVICWGAARLVLELFGSRLLRRRCKSAKGCMPKPRRKRKHLFIEQEWQQQQKTQV